MAVHDIECARGNYFRRPWIKVCTSQIRLASCESLLASNSETLSSLRISAVPPSSSTSRCRCKSWCIPKKPRLQREGSGDLRRVSCRCLVETCSFLLHMFQSAGYCLGGLEKAPTLCNPIENRRTESFLVVTQSGTGVANGLLPFRKKRRKAAM